MKIAASLPRLQSASQLFAAAPSPAPRDEFRWSKALALPAYVYGGASATLSSLVSYAAAHPPGGVVIGPAGMRRLPRWTRHFSPGSPLHSLQPILAGISAGVQLVRGGAELAEGYRRGDRTGLVAGSLDLALAAVSAVSTVSPGVGGLRLALLAGRVLLDLHRPH